MKWPSHSSILLNAYRNLFYYTKCDAYILFIVNFKFENSKKKIIIIMR